MQKDIEGRAEIETLINTFYDKVKKDDLISHFFTEVILVDWDKHLAIMYDFWESTLFGTDNYKGNTMLKHIELDKKSTMEPIHFESWLKLFISTVDELFTGKNSITIKQRAMSIATVIQIKIETNKNKQ